MMRSNRSDMHHAAAAGLLHGFGKGPGRQQIARQIDADDLIPLVELDVLERTGAQNARIVDQCRARTELAFDDLCRPGDAVCVRCVTSSEEHKSELQSLMP